MEKDIAISVKNLTKVYHLYDSPKDRLKEALNPFGKKYHHDFYALKDVSFEIKKGETVGIIGKNGAGKSTLLKIITGVLTPTSGEVEVNGKIASLLELGAGFNPEMTGLENIYLNGTIMGFTKEEMDAKIDAILAFADIGEFIHQPVKMYSSGMFARLAFSVAINVEPDVLIVDEALSVGDEKFQRKCFAKIESMAQEECTILFVTHSTNLLETICSYGLLLIDGALASFGEGKKVVEEYRAYLYGENGSPDQNQKMEDESNSAESFSEKDAVILPIAEKADKDIQITGVWLYDKSGHYDKKEFQPHEYITFGLRIKSDIDIDELMVGIRIKTMEGVEVFGGSSDYIHRNIKHLTKGSIVDAEFSTHLHLASGHYFVTYAIADKNHLDGMVYQDKVIDILDFKIVEYPLTSSGIVALEYDLVSKKVTNV